jgi:hypothetical protein
MNIGSLVSYLRNVDARLIGSPDSQHVEHQLVDCKREAVSNCDQSLAKEIWCYETILHAQDLYLKAFQEMKEAAYYKAWCTLEQSEIELHCLERHFNYRQGNDQYQLQFISKQIGLFQSLFPYRLFISPSMLHLEKHCSICGAVRGLRNTCGHVHGGIYDGEMCSNVITKVELLEISVVTRPVQKYSVLFTSDPKTGKQCDHYNYSMVEYVIGALHSPFDEWDITWTKIRHPHSRYSHIGRNDQCPCGSGRKYKHCCLRESGVLGSHAEVHFSVPPPKDYPAFMYTS